MGEYTDIETEIFYYLNNNVINFNYANRLMQLQDKNLYFLLNNDQKFQLYIDLRTECIDAIKNEIKNNNESNVKYLLLFQHMLIYKKYLQVQHINETDGMEDLLNQIKLLYKKVRTFTEKSPTINLIKKFVKHFIKNESSLKSNSMLLNLLELLMKLLMEVLTNEI